MNKKLLLSITAAFAIILLFDFIYNSFTLKSFYSGEAGLMNNENIIRKFAFWSLICHLIGAIILNIFISLKYSGDSLRDSLRDGLIYGLLIGCLLSIKSLFFYAYTPLPFVLPVLWFIGSIIEFSLVGVVIVKINR